MRPTKCARAWARFKGRKKATLFITRPAACAAKARQQGSREALVEQADMHIRAVVTRH